MCLYKLLTPEKHSTSINLIKFQNIAKMLKKCKTFIYATPCIM